ncbi:DUF550 domain-containing protein [Salmonella enterica]
MTQLYDDLNDHYAPPEVVRELARIALTSMDAKPVYQYRERTYSEWQGCSERYYRVAKEMNTGLTRALYTAPPVSERERIRREHAEWSDATFGDVGPIGPLKHLSKEALEAAADPSDPLEWADMQFLLWDAQRRMGLSDEFITRAMIEKLAINKARQWPEPKDGEPRLHIKEQPVSVVPDGLRQALSNAGIAAPESDEMLAATCEKYIQMLVTWVKDRKPFQPAPVMPAELHPDTQNLMADFCTALAEKLYKAQLKYGYDADWKQAGWVMVPVEPTDEMIEAAMNCEDVLFNSDGSFCVQFGNIYEAMLAAAPQPEVK